MTGLARLLRPLMAKQGLSKSGLARKMFGDEPNGAARNRCLVGDWVNGKSLPDRENLPKLADALGVTAEELTVLRPYLRWSFETIPDEPDKLLLTIDGAMPPTLLRRLVQEITNIAKRKRSRKPHAYRILLPA
jgi:transcriptional regulator with XRE-family HTH domain